MASYILRRLLLLPLTLFLILLVNFIILNLAPGVDPSEKVQISETGDMTRKADEDARSAGENAHLQFREHYGLTLPILVNLWPWTSEYELRKKLDVLLSHKASPEAKEEIPIKEYNELRVEMGDQARFAMYPLLSIVLDPQSSFTLKQEAMRFLVRGATMQGYVGPDLSDKQKAWNRKVASDNMYLTHLLLAETDTPAQTAEKVKKMKQWVQANSERYQFAPTTGQKIKMLFLDTRFVRYMSKVCTLDFGSLRNDRNRTVLSEVVKRFKYSLTLAFVPMVLTFFLCQVIGLIMAVYQNRTIDISLNVLSLILYAIPVFVVAPFLIEKVALYNTFPFTDLPFPLSGFSSEEKVYEQMTSLRRLGDVAMHLVLPLIAIMYGSLAAQSRLSRTAFLEVMRQDFVRTARAKGCSPATVNVKHVGRNAAITIVTSLASSLGVVLGGSLIVETIFGIDGFGRFFYEAILNRDFNVVMFSTFAGSLLALLGYLLADIAYTLLDPRVTLD